MSSVLRRRTSTLMPRFWRPLITTCTSYGAPQRGPVVMPPYALRAVAISSGQAPRSWSRFASSRMLPCGRNSSRARSPPCQTISISTSMSPRRRKMTRSTRHRIRRLRSSWVVEGASQMRA